MYEANTLAACALMLSRNNEGQPLDPIAKEIALRQLSADGTPLGFLQVCADSADDEISLAAARALVRSMR